MEQNKEFRRYWRISKRYEHAGDMIGRIAAKERNRRNGRRRMILLAASVLIIFGVSAIFLEDEIFKGKTADTLVVIPEFNPLENKAAIDSLLTKEKWLYFVSPNKNESCFSNDTVMINFRSLIDTSFLLTIKHDNSIVYTKEIKTFKRSFTFQYVPENAGIYECITNDTILWHSFTVKNKEE